MERHAPELYDWVQKEQRAPEMWCAILDVVSWFPGVLQHLWTDVSVRCPHAERYNESASKPGAATVAGEAEKTKRCGMAVRALVFETCGRLGGESTKLLRDLVATAAANGQCSPHAVGRWRTQLQRVMLTAEADTYLRALGSGVAERPAAEPLLMAEWSVHSFCLFEVFAVRLSCEGSSDRDRDGHILRKVNRASRCGCLAGVPHRWRNTGQWASCSRKAIPSCSFVNGWHPCLWTHQ